MKRWPVEDAGTRFDELLAASQTEGPQFVVNQGIEVAVLVSIEEWRHLRRADRPSVKDVLLAPEPRFDLELPKRRRWKRRPPIVFD
jgi:prevent-host-death family protein